MTNEEQIYKAAIDEGLTPVLANLMIAQSKQESGPGYTNRASREHNNVFGYKYVGQKLTDANGVNQVTGPGNMSSEGDRPYAHYTSVYWSAVEMARWLKRNVPGYNSITTPSQYAMAIKAGKIGAYFGDSVENYTKGMTRWFTNTYTAVKTYVKQNPVKATAVVLTVAAMSSYFLWLVLRNKK